MAKKQEVAIIENKEVTELVENSGIAKTEAQSIASKFMPFMQKVNDISSQIEALMSEELTPDVAAKFRRLRLDLVKNRGKEGLLTVHKDQKEDVLIKGRLVDGLKNVIESSSMLAENKAEEKEKFQERQEKLKRDALALERVALLTPYEVDFEFLPLDIMEEEKFQTLLFKSKESFEAVTAKRKADELARVEAERKAEADRQAEIEAEKQRQIERDAENERLKKEAESREKELAKERAEAEKKAKEQELLRQQEQAKADAILKAERKAREKVEAELEAKRVQEEAERQQSIAEQNERDAKAKAALLAPDKEKINALFIQIRDFQFPECSTDEAKTIINDVKEGFKIILTGITEKSKSMK